MKNFFYVSQLKGHKIKLKQNELPKERKAQLNKSLINCIIADSRPFNDFRKRGMLSFLSDAVPGFKPLHRKTVAAKLSHRMEEFLNKLRKVLSKVDHLALTTDLWKNRKSSYFMCLTAHFFDINFSYSSLII